MCAVRHASVPEYSHPPSALPIRSDGGLEVCSFSSSSAYARLFGPATLLLHLIFNEEPDACAWICTYIQVSERLANSIQSQFQKWRKSRTQNYLKTYKHLNIHETAPPHLQTTLMHSLSLSLHKM